MFLVELPQLVDDVKSLPGLFYGVYCRSQLQVCRDGSAQEPEGLHSSSYSPPWPQLFFGLISTWLHNSPTQLLTGSHLLSICSRLTTIPNKSNISRVDCNPIYSASLFPIVFKRDTALMDLLKPFIIDFLQLF